MADIITDWTDGPQPATGKDLSHADLTKLSTRLDTAINDCQKQIEEMNREVQDLQGRLARMHDTKRKLHEIVWAAADVEAVEGLTNDHASGTTRKKKATS